MFIFCSPGPPEHAIEHEVAGGRFGVVTVEPELDSRPIVVAQRRDRLLSPAERSFVELIRKVEDWPDQRPDESKLASPQPG